MCSDRKINAEDLFSELRSYQLNGDVRSVYQGKRGAVNSEDLLESSSEGDKQILLITAHRWKLRFSCMTSSNYLVTGRKFKGVTHSIKDVRNLPDSAQKDF